MHNVFRHFAIARILADRRVFQEAGFDASFLLDNYDVPATDTPSTVPGIGRIDEFRYKRKTDGRVTNWTTWNSICGGVSVAFNDDLKAGEDDGYIQGAGSMILAKRPGLEDVSWDVSGFFAPVSREAVKSKIADVSTGGDDEPVVVESIADVLSRSRKPAAATSPPGSSIEDILKKFK
jgi:hypothetical protein